MPPMIKICLCQLRKAAYNRKPGYQNECSKVGLVEGGRGYLPEAEFTRIARDYAK